MPRKVDHHARRTELADALMRVAADRGLESVSLRHVATEAGVTAGMVQHYFRTKDEMMTFALAAVSERVQARLAARPRPETPRAVVAALLVELLPLDAVRTLEAHVGLAFLAYAAVKPEIAADLREGTSAMRATVADEVRAAQHRGFTTTAVEPAAAGAILLSLVEGLSLHVLGGHLTADEAVAALGAQLDVLLGPEVEDPLFSP